MELAEWRLRRWAPVRSWERRKGENLKEPLGVSHPGGLFSFSGCSLVHYKALHVLLDQKADKRGFKVDWWTRVVG